MKDAVMDSWFFDERSDKVDDMINTNLSIIEQKESIIAKYLKKYRYLMGIQEMFYIFAA